MRSRRRIIVRRRRIIEIRRSRIITMRIMIAEWAVKIWPEVERLEANYIVRMKKKVIREASTEYNEKKKIELKN